jgi:hypothetical protein
MHMSDCPILNNRELHFLVIQSKGFSTTASLSCDPIESFSKIHRFNFLVIQIKASQKSTASLSCGPIQSLLNNQQLYFLVIQSKVFSTIHSFTFL